MLNLVVSLVTMSSFEHQPMSSEQPQSFEFMPESPVHCRVQKRMALGNQINGSPTTG